MTSRKGQAVARVGRVELATAAALLAIVAAYFAWRTLVRHDPEVDFRYFWAAGRAWATGVDPYGAAFSPFANRVVPPGNHVGVWAYPPQWWLVCRLLGAATFGRSLLLWRLAGCIAAVATTAVLALDLARPARGVQVLLPVAVACFLLLVEPTAQAIAYGQSSLLIYAGAALVAIGYLRRRTATLALGLAIVMLKPQVGIPIALYLAVDPRNWPAIALAAAVSLLAALPHLVPNGTVATLRQLVANLGAYGAHGANRPDALTGPIQLLARGGVMLPAWIEFAGGVLVALVAGLAARRRGGDGRRQPLALMLAAVAALSPLHGYDLTLLVLPILLTWPSSTLPAGRPVLALAALLLVRPGKIEGLLHFAIHGGGVSTGAFLGTIAALGVLFVTAAEFVSRRNAPAGQRP